MITVWDEFSKTSKIFLSLIFLTSKHQESKILTTILKHLAFQSVENLQPEKISFVARTRELSSPCECQAPGGPAILCVAQSTHRNLF